ncbi:MAG TPA: dihydrolipoamide acetyltransferase family protein [Gammaproteobacteria bacterium]|nr:dihydrolipoamide acetyltransferase family protein [Gammaproteobacteria bacterium]
MKTFNLPDLGEGLPEAEIVRWHVAEGDTIKTDEPLVSVETAKAVVEVPSPHSGRIAKLHAGEGDIVQTGKPLVDFDIASAASEAETRRPAREVEPDEAPAQQAAEEKAARRDSGTVVGDMPSSDEELVETVRAGSRRKRTQKSRVKAAPAVRALAKKLDVDLDAVEPTGKSRLVTADDVKRHGKRREAAEPRPARQREERPRPTGESEPLRGPRRAMAQSMAQSRDQIAPCTLFDDADVHGWPAGQDITARLIRAMVAGCRAEPGLNALFDADSMSRRIMDRIDLAMAVDTPDGLIVPVLRGVEDKDASDIRNDLDAIKQATRSRTVAPGDMRDFTITLSNFGMLAGRYATPIIVPPTVAILGTGGIRHDVVPVMGGIEVHRRIPLSLTFDHRCVTGGEACRFLAAVIADLGRTG